MEIRSLCVFVAYLYSSEALLPEERLVAHLFGSGKYNPHVRPAPDHTRPLVVNLALQLLTLNDVNTKEQIISASGWLSQTWNDPRLVWDSANYNGADSMVLPPGEVWVPDVALENAAGDPYSESMKHFRVVVYEDGEVSWEPGTTYVALCDIDVTYYPFDQQVCKFVFSNWAYSGLAVNLTYEDKENVLIGMTEKLAQNGEWEILKVDVSRMDTYYACCPDTPYGEVQFKLLLQRKPLFYLINVVCPAVMLSILVLLVFLLPSDSGEKISMGVTLLLAFSVFILMISDNVPNTSLAVPLIQIYLVLFMGVTCLTVIVSVIVLYMHHQGAPRAPLWLRRSCFLHLNRMLPKKTTYKFKKDELQFHSSKTKVKPGPDITDATKTFEVPLETLGPDEISEEWRAIARIFDQFFFWRFMIIFVLGSAAVLGIVPASAREKTF